MSDPAGRLPGPSLPGRAGAEDAGRKIAEEAKNATDALTGAISNLADVMKDPENRRILIEVLNRANANVFDDAGSLNPGDPNVSTR